jgi:triacylglycerol lipase
MESTHQTAVVFVHGFFGFSEFRLPGKRVAYFRGVGDALSDIGVACYFPRLPAGSSVASRAASLARYLENVPEKDLILIAFSMGGLDSRYLIHKLDPGRRVRRLVTIGTPHRGSSLAEWALNKPRLINFVARALGRPALEDMRPSACDRFNREIPNRTDVIYSSYAANRAAGEMPYLFRRWAGVIAANENIDNDSQVSVASARWGEFKGVLTADHWELIGWNLAKRKKVQPFDHILFYRELVTGLVAA